MNLPFFKKSSPKESSREYIFSVEIGRESVKTAIWTIANQKVQVIIIGPAVPWDQITPESLTSACDVSLSEATQKLDKSGKTQPEKMILGLPPDWISDEKIQPEKLKLLRHITKELSLKAIGFVIVPEALVKNLETLEGARPTAILIGVNNDTCEITLIRQGKVDSFETVRRSGQTGSDIAEGLSRFSTGNMLSSRMLLYDSGKNLKSFRQDILTFPWQAPQHRLPFLHFPKVEILASDFSVSAISQAGGGEVAKSISLPVSTSETAAPTSSPAPGTDSVLDLGFFPDVDVAREPPPELPVPAEGSSPVKTKTKPGFGKFRFPAIRFPKVRLSGFSWLRRLVFIVLPLLLLAGLLGWFVWFRLQATVTLTISPRTLDTTFDLTLDPSISQPDSAAGLLPTVEVSTIITDQQSKAATGQKIIGDKAVGEVSIINGTSTPRLFPAGTVISSPAGLKFTLDSSVEVASASGTADPNSYQPGKATAKVTASVIGSDSNLSAGTQFRIGTFSSLDYVARNDAAFTGGSSRQVKAVSKQDAADLKNLISASLSEKAASELVSDSSSNQIVIPGSITIKTETENLSPKVDEVADTVSLELGIKAMGASISKSDLENLVAERIAAQAPAGYEPGTKFDFNFEIKRRDGQKLLITVSAAAELIPQVNREDIISKLAGKTTADGLEYLKSLTGVSNSEITFNPGIFNWMPILPHDRQNIDLAVKTAR